MHNNKPVKILTQVIEVAREKLKKNTHLHKFVCFQVPNINKGFSSSGLASFIIWVRNYLFLKKYVTSEGAVSHNVLYNSFPLLINK